MAVKDTTLHGGSGYSGPGRRVAYPIVIAVCALPRLVALVHERSAVLDNFEKSRLLAQMYLKTGTFGFVPGHPSAYTQPLYGWFLIPIFWIAGFHWWSVGTVQVAVAVATALVVFEIGRRFLSARIGLVAAVISTLQPYLIWHDIHGNREILDQLLGAGLFGLTLLAGSSRSLRIAIALGLVSGIAILSNTRLAALPVVLAVYLLWRRVGWTAAIAVLVFAGVALAPWVIRNKAEVGCWAITTDARALWKANNPSTYSTLASGLWIDQVADTADIPQRRLRPVPDRWLTPEEAGGFYLSKGEVIAVPECAQTAHYEHLVLQFWEHHPGAKAKLVVQATEMLWNPRVEVEGAQESGVDSVRKWVEPLYTVPLFLLAIAGLLVVPASVRWLALIFALYETAGAWVFAGTTRYRVPWDFVLALLAAAALERIAVWLASKRRPLIL